MKKFVTFYFIIAIFVSCGSQTGNDNSDGGDSVSTDPSASLTNTDFRDNNANSDETSFLLDNLLKYNSEKELIAAFGKDIKHSKQWGAEGIEEYHCSLLYPETKNEVEFTWNDSIKFTGIISIRISGESADWKTKEGIALGTTLKELEKLNKKPFTFLGFGWDYAGTTMWDEGYLDKTNNHVRLGLKGEVTEEFNNLMGDGEFKSNSALAQKANPVVVELWLSKDQ